MIPDGELCTSGWHAMKINCNGRFNNETYEIIPIYRFDIVNMPKDLSVILVKLVRNRIMLKPLVNRQAKRSSLI